MLIRFGALLPAWPLVARAPKGDGHSVTVFTGLSANNASTLPLGHYLPSLGYKPWGCAQDFNFVPRAGELKKPEQSRRKAAGNRLQGQGQRALARVDISRASAGVNSRYATNLQCVDWSAQHYLKRPTP